VVGFEVLLLVVVQGERMPPSSPSPRDHVGRYSEEERRTKEA